MNEAVKKKKKTSNDDPLVDILGKKIVNMGKDSRVRIGRAAMDIFATVNEDVQATKDRDPAARSSLEA